MNLYELFIKLGVDDSALNTGLNNAKTAISNIGSVASGLTATIAGAVGAGSTAVIAFGKSAVDAGKDFDTSMSQVAATMGTTVDDIQELSDFAQKMGATTAFSASQAADALNYMALAGYDSNTSMKMLPNVLDLAAAGGMELATASDMITDSQSALGLSIEETSELVDKMAKASSKTNTSVSQLGDAILTVGGTAKNLAGGTTELAQVLGLMADNGIKASESGTHLRNIMLSLTPKSEDAAAAMEEIGLNAYDSEGKLRPLQDVFQDLNAGLDGMTDLEKQNILTAIFNKTDLAAINALLSTTSDRWEEVASAIDGSWYTMESLSENLSNAGTNLDDMTSRLEKLGISSDDLAEALNKSGGNAEDFIDALWEWSNAGTDIEDITDAIGISLEDLEMAFNNTSGAAAAMAETQLDNLAGDITLMESALEGVQIAVSNELTPVLREFVQLAGNSLGELKDAIVAGDFEQIEQIFFDTFNNALGIMNDLVPQIIQLGEMLVSSLVNSIISNAPEMLTGAVSIVTTLIDGIAAGSEDFAGSIMKILTLLVTTITDNVDTILTGGLNIIKGIVKGFGDNFSLFSAAVVDLIGELGMWIAENLPDVIKMGFELLSSIVKGITDNLPELATTALEVVQKLIDETLTHLPEIMDMAFDLLMAIVDGIVNNISEIATATGRIIGEITGSIAENLPEIYDKGYELLGKIAAGIIDNIPEIIGAAIDLLTSTINTLAFEFDWMQIGKDIIVGIGDGIKKGVTAIGDAIDSAGEAIESGFKDFFGISSPSKLMREKIGKFIPQGIAEGIENSKDYVNKAIEKVTKSAGKPIKLNTNIDTIDTNIATNVATGFKTAKAKSSFVSGQKPIVININGIQYQNIEQLTNAIADTLQNLTMREAAGYGV